MTVDLTEKTKPRLELELDLNPVSKRQHWIFSMKQKTGESGFSAIVPISFFNPEGLFSGKADYQVNHSTAGKATLEADIEGETHLDGVVIDLYVTTKFHREVFATIRCEGTKDTETSYSGQSHIPCRKPDECGCEGYYGDFTLTAEES